MCQYPCSGAAAYPGRMPTLLNDRAVGLHAIAVVGRAQIWAYARVVAYVCPAASRITFVMTSGWDISERWLAFTSIVFAPMRLAMNRSISGLMVRSSVDTAYQLGFDRHAAWV